MRISNPAAATCLGLALAVSVAHAAQVAGSQIGQVIPPSAQEKPIANVAGSTPPPKTRPLTSPQRPPASTSTTPH